METTRSPSVLTSPVERVVLTGFMGSGKTTVGRLLAVHLGWDFLDLDDGITRRTGLSVPEIFARFGEPHFRHQEHLALAECLQRQRLVLALGGGAPETDANRTLLTGSASTAVVYLSGDFETLQARCLAQSAEPGAVARPVLADAELARERFRKRAPLYTELATTTLDTGERSPEHLAKVLADALLPQVVLGEPRPETP